MRLPRLPQLTWSRLAAAAIVIERAHNTAKTYIPRYQKTFDNLMESLKLRTGLKENIAHEVLKHMKLEDSSRKDLEAILRWQMQFYRSADLSVLFELIAKHTKIQAVYTIAKDSSKGQIVTSINELIALLSNTSSADNLMKREAWDWETWDIPYFLSALEIYEDKEALALIPKKRTFKGTYPGVIALAYLNKEPFIFIVDYSKELAVTIIEYRRGTYITTKLDDTTSSSKPINRDHPNIQRDQDSPDHFFIKKMKEINPLKGCVVSFDEADSDYSWGYYIDGEDSLTISRFKKEPVNYEVFTQEIKDILFNDIPGFLRNKQLLKDKGFDRKRSYLFAGPPGTGKTNIIKAIINTIPKEYTVIMTNGGNLKDVGDFLDEIPTVKPVMVVIEDIDLILNRDDDRQALLNFLDGFDSRDDMLVVMTTNNPEILGDSLTKRPGRIDRICYVLVGDEAARTQQLRLLTKGIEITFDPEEVAKSTENLTFAVHREAVRRALIYSQDNKISHEAIMRAIEECTDQFSGELRTWKDD
jgi:hypothetical protein